MLVDILSSPLSKISETSIEIEAVSLLRNFFGNSKNSQEIRIGLLEKLD